MKRSQINDIIRESDAFIRSHGFHLPPFAYWSPEDWTAKGPEVSEIADNQLGWDITDFGSGDFESKGLFLFTLRNGHPENLQTMRGKLYAEKIMIVGVDQVTPMHYHWNKTEDIINRGGGHLVIELYNATEDDQLDDAPVTVSTDGITRTVDAGGKISLTPGESITLPTKCFHKFWGEDSAVLVGEVSLINDDNKDNKFYNPVGRFPEIEEDTKPVHLLVGDYQQYYSH